MNRIILFAGLSLFLNTQLIAAPNLDQAAADACHCLKGPYEEIAKTMVSVKQAQQSGDMSKLTASQGEMMAILQSSVSCFEALSKNYPEIDKSDDLKKQVVEKTEQMCPNPALSN